MQSEKVVRQVKDTNDMLVEIGDGALVEQLSDSESKEISDKVVRQYPELHLSDAPRLLEYLMARECKIRMNKRERFIYENGVAHGLKRALDWVLGDIDDIFQDYYKDS